MDASRTRCASIPACRAPCSQAAARAHDRDRVTGFAPFRPRFFVARGPAFRLGILSPAMGARGSSRRSFLRRSSQPRRSGFHRTLLPAEWVSQGACAPLTPGSSDPNAFRRSCSDPARIRQTRLAAHLRGCCWDRHPCGRWTHRAASFHLHRELGDSREPEDGTVGLDPSRACVRPPLFTMFDHGWPPLPMTRP